MKSKSHISKVERNSSENLRYYIGSWLIFTGLLISLTVLHVWAEETAESENNDAEVEQTAVVTTENTDDSAHADSIENKDEMVKEPVSVTKEVITGTSDRMDRDEKVGVTILIGNAKTKRHTEDGVEIGFLNADSITIKTDPETGETTEIVAVGNVEIRDDKIFATCDHATMDNLTSIITLKENVVVLQNKDRLETKLFTFNRITGKQTGVGGVKFKVEVTQATPTETTEDSEETDPDNKVATGSSDTTDKAQDESEKKIEDEEKSETDSDTTDSNENSAKKESKKIKEEVETEEESDTEETESDENDQSATEEKDETEAEVDSEETDDEDTEE